MSSLKLPNGNGRDSLSPGRKVILGVRPEHFNLYDEHLAERRAGFGRLDAPVEVVEPTGAETIVIVRVGEAEVIARFEPDDAPKVGETVALAIDMTKACLFDPDTEKLI